MDLIFSAVFFFFVIFVLLNSSIPHTGKVAECILQKLCAVSPPFRAMVVKAQFPLPELTGARFH